MYVLQIRTFMELFHTNEPLNVKIGLNFISLQQYTIYYILLLYILRPLYNFLADFALYFSLKLFFNSISLLLIQQSIVYQLKFLKKNVFNYLSLCFFFVTNFPQQQGNLCFPGKPKRKKRIRKEFIYVLCLFFSLEMRIKKIDKLSCF